MSLLYALQGLDRDRFEPIVALIRPNPEVSRLYEQAGVEVVSAPDIGTFEHTTACAARFTSPIGIVSFVRGVLRWNRSKRATLALVQGIRPDLVHLNSVVLLPSATALNAASIPFVWQVREAPARGYFGIRKAFVSRALCRFGEEVVFICRSDQKAWTDQKRGTVIYNFVDFKKFDFHHDQSTARRSLGIAAEAKVVLYLGGIARIKGVSILLEALAAVRKRFPETICLMPNSTLESSGRFISRAARKLLPLIGSGVFAQQVKNQISELKLETALRLLPFQSSIATLIAASDLIAFPSIEPHFARPVIEAAAMAKPVIASDLGGVNELIEHGKTGLLCPAGNAQALANGLELLLQDAELRMQLGQEAHRQAVQRFESSWQVDKLMQIYERILAT